MIFSRTASTDDLEELDLKQNIIVYLEIPKKVENYSSALYKFWDYSLLLKLIKYYSLNESNILNITNKNRDVTLDIISDYYSLNINQMSFGQFSKLPIKKNRFDIICSFGILEHIKNPSVFVEKLSKHPNKGGFIIITTEENISSTKKRTITSEDLLSYSILLEQMGYDLCSDEFDLLKYTENSNLHSLVMKRIGN